MGGYTFSMSAPNAAQLVHEFTSLSLSLARRWARTYPHLSEECRSEAGFTLWRFAVGFTGQVQFFAYQVRRRINGGARSTGRGGAATDPAAFRQPTDDERDPLDLATDHGPAVGSDMALREVLSGLTPRGREAVETRADGGSFREIGTAMGLNSSQRADHVPRRGWEAAVAV